jgi:hypothetical protein
MIRIEFLTGRMHQGSHPLDAAGGSVGPQEEW